jgi:LysR family transcriptional regulator, nitrogen assimilation regulatory protein
MSLGEEEAMDIRSLTHFQKVAELGSITRAAADLDMAQPGLSRDIALLERELGTKLFTRQARGMQLTEAGRILQQRALALIRQIGDLREDIAAESSAPSGRVSLGLPISMIDVLTGPFVERFTRAFPRVLLNVYEGISDQLEALVRHGEVDIAILIALRRPIPNADVRPLMTEQLYLIGPRNSGLSVKKPVDWTSLNGRVMILHSPPNYLRLRMDQVTHQKGLDFRVAAEVSTLPLMLRLVEKGVGYGVMPLCAIREALSENRLSAAPMRNVYVTWTLAVTRERPDARAIPEAVRIINEMINEQARRGTWTVRRSA